MLSRSGRPAPPLVTGRQDSPVQLPPQLAAASVLRGKKDPLIRCRDIGIKYDDRAGGKEASPVAQYAPS